MTISPTQLKAFHAVAINGSFTRAAEQLLEHLHTGGRSGHQALSRGRRQDRPGHHGSLRQLMPPGAGRQPRRGVDSQVPI